MVYFGHPLHTVKDAKAHSICKVVSEFALEYRTTREKIREQAEKKRREADRNANRHRRISDSVSAKINFSNALAGVCLRLEVPS